MVVIEGEVDVDVADVEIPLAMAARAMEPMRADCERILTEVDQRLRAGWENRMGVWLKSKILDWKVSERWWIAT